MKTFLSIGSGPGIGIATAERFAREGFRIVLTSRDVEGLSERARHLEAKGYVVEVKAVDAGDLASVSALIRETEAQFGPVNVTLRVVRTSKRTPRRRSRWLRRREMTEASRPS